jgi:hypothetical protein
MEIRGWRERTNKGKRELEGGMERCNIQFH